jgi:GxxExxY protein
MHERLSYRVIGAAIEVHKRLGPGLLESVYHHCLAVEMADRGIPFAREVPLPLVYKDRLLEAQYRVDFLVGSELIVELKALEHIEPVHRAQVLSYLRLSGKYLGLLLNFNVVRMEDGLCGPL